MLLSRRHFATLAASPLLAQSNPKTILLRGSWQTENIGDIAHTPGFLRIAQQHLPGVKIILWPARELDRGVEPLLRGAFPGLEIVTEPPQVQAAMERADLFVQGSAASPSAVPQMESWWQSFRKPYGFFGITVTRSSEAVSAAVNERTKAVLDGASFLFTRETKSLENVRALDVKARQIAFIPDATFSMDLRDDAKADAFLKAHGLKEGGFVCVIPRLRYTPYHRFRKMDWTLEEIQRRDTRNLAKQEEDASKLRRVAHAAFDSKLRAVFCAEMTYQLEMLRPLLFDRLSPAERKTAVVRDSYWLPDEAASLYRRAAAVVSCECHSPILATVQGTPGAYLHQAEDGIKGQMWADLGLGARYFELDSLAEPEKVLEPLLAAGARAATAGAAAKAQQLHAQGAQVLRAML